MSADQIAAIRRFNRLVTQRIGALEEDFLGRHRPLGQSRVLFEIGRDGADLRELRARLGLDSGYLTRIVQALAGAGLVEVERASADERVRRVRLSRAGLRELTEMDRRSDGGAAALLDALGESQRERLVKAMDEVRRLLQASGIRIERVDPESSEARWCLEQYRTEIDSRFESGFDPALAIPAPPDAFIPPRGSFLVASLDGRNVACGGIRALSPTIGYIKRMWVAEEVRGLGLGRRMLSALEDQGAQLGFRTVRLETNRALREAIEMYRSAGYREVPPFNEEPYAHHWFEKRLGRARKGRTNP